ncbi:uncharacterized protein LOC116417643 [Nasonia vitripennis]|uniref:Uncharacterized protein n=1 Tax=Nasonia vitripennis TaxID=7425 RepID=A0A7M7QJS0_NASVI|nr:uncharacterized protein LOC116417643 [Nasonia vitripennis]
MAPNVKLAEKRNNTELDSSAVIDDNTNSQGKPRSKWTKKRQSPSFKKSIIHRVLVNKEARSKICLEFDLAESTLRGWLDSPLAQEVLEEVGISKPSVEKPTIASAVDVSSPPPPSCLSERFGSVANMPLNSILGYCSKLLDQFLMDPSSIDTEKLIYLERRLQSEMSKTEVLELLKFLEDMDAAKIQRAAEAAIRCHQRSQREPQ